MMPRGTDNLPRRRVWLVSAGETLMCFGGHRLKRHDGSRIIHNPQFSGDAWVKDRGAIRCRHSSLGRPSCPVISFLIAAGFRDPDGLAMVIQAEVTAAELRVLEGVLTWREQMTLLDIRYSSVVAHAPLSA